MAAAYELWETRSGNLMGAYETEQRALLVVSKAVQAHGPGYIDSIALVKVNRRGDPKPLARGEALLQRARTADHERGPVPA